METAEGQIFVSDAAAAGSVEPTQATAEAGVAEGPHGNVPERDAGAAPLEAGTPLDAGSAPDAGASADANGEPDTESDLPRADGLTSCTIAASTDAEDAAFYPGHYGCAVWIGDLDGGLVKGLFSAGRVAQRTTVAAFRMASQGVPDIVASATLHVPKQHQYTWNLKDRRDAAVAPGKYTLLVGTRDTNGETVVAVPFDTWAHPVSAKGVPDGGIRSAAISCE